MRRFHATTASVAVIALLVAGTATPVTAAEHRPPLPRPAARVSAADFPTVGQVARVFPRTRAVRFFTHRRPLKLRPDCIGGARTAVRTRGGKRAFYTLAGGRDPYDVGLPLPGMDVYRYRTPRQARSAFAEIAASFPPCYGTTNDPSGFGNDFAPLRTPRIGRARYGIRNVSRSPTRSPSWLIEVWAVAGRCLTDTWVERSSNALRPRQLFALARLVVRSACSGSGA
jgi:hypothetical protein